MTACCSKRILFRTSASFYRPIDSFRRVMSLACARSHVQCVWCLLLGSALLTSCAAASLRYPQCRDRQPPFQTSDTLPFCEQYSTFGCCSRDEADGLKKRHDDIIARLSDKQVSECRAYISEFLCATCSPYSNILHQSLSHKRPLPGLCRKYCERFYSECRIIVGYLTNNTDVVASLAHVDKFCAESASGMSGHYCYPELLTNVELNAGLKKFATMKDGCLCLDEFATGLSNPLLLRAPPDNSRRVFIAQQSGVLSVFYTNKTRVQTPFMNLSTTILASKFTADHRGFLGLAFHPAFASNGKLYAYFSVEQNDQEKIRISEFLVAKNDANSVDRNSERVILEVEQPYKSHNGGEILFGEDGYMYAFLGDGGGVGDPLGNSQNKSVLLGKVLRIDVDTGDPRVLYRIPDDNPFVGEVGARPEIYAYGVRNMWRADVDAGDSEGLHRGRILGADVGEKHVEEVDILQSGGNYGWNVMEGFDCYTTAMCGKIGPVVKPIHAYRHSQPGAIIGGHVYRGCRNPSLQGQYIFGDFVTGQMFSLTEHLTSGEWTSRQVALCASDVCHAGGWSAVHAPNIMSFGKDADGEIYVLTSDMNSPREANGKVHKIVDPRRSGDRNLCRSTVTVPSRAPRDASIGLLGIFIISIVISAHY